MMHGIMQAARRRIRRWRLPDHGWIDVEREGLHLRLDLGSYVDRRIAVEGRWEPDTVALLRDLVAPGMVAADIGANFGYFSLLLADWVGPEGHVVAFEPIAQYGDRLERHLKCNAAGNVTLFRSALSDTERAVDIAIGVSSATMHWAASDPPRRMERVRTLRLDDWWHDWLGRGGTDRLDVVKIDVDGHELRVLDGAEATFRRHMPHMVIEFSQEAMRAAGSDVELLADRLEAFGYQLCDERTRQPYADRRALLHAAGNFAFSQNVWARPW